METLRQIYFRKYGEHIVECQQCRATPRSEASMCELGRSILLTYRDEMQKDLDKITTASKMPIDDLVHTLEVLRDKPEKTTDDQNMIDAIDQLIKEKVERLYK